MRVTGMAFKMEPEMQAYLNSAQVTEDGIPSGDYHGPSSFRSYLRANWREILDNIQTIAPNRPQQAVIFATAAFLPSPEYLDFMAATIDQFEKGNLDATAVRHRVLFPPRHRYGFLQFNYQNPQVRSICEKAKRLFPSDQQLQEYLSDILSGAGKEHAEDWLSQNKMKPPEVLASVTPPTLPRVRPGAATPMPAPPAPRKW